MIGTVATVKSKSRLSALEKRALSLCRKCGLEHSMDVLRAELTRLHACGIEDHSDAAGDGVDVDRQRAVFEEMLRRRAAGLSGPIAKAGEP
jgi:predicted aminopeptidase